MEAPVDIFPEEGIKRWAKESFQKGRYETEEKAFAACMEIKTSGHFQSWGWYYDYMTERAREVLTDISILVLSYRYDDSDAMIDYFDTNFYPHFYIGKWNKPLKIVPRTERISHNNGPKGARRITA
jgi:hypothetical protein